MVAMSYRPNTFYCHFKVNHINHTFTFKQINWPHFNIKQYPHRRRLWTAVDFQNWFSVCSPAAYCCCCCCCCALHKSNTQVQFNKLKLQTKLPLRKWKWERIVIVDLWISVACNCHFSAPAREILISDVGCGGQPPRCAVGKSNKQDWDDLLSKACDMFMQG